MKSIRPLDIKNSWGGLLHEVAKLLKRRFEEEVRVYNVTLPQFRVLAQIALGQDSSQKALAASIDVDPMTMSGILDRLEKRGLINRIPDPGDSRAKLAAVTEEGAEIVESARNVGLGVLEEGLQGLSEKERTQLKYLLGRMRDNLVGEPARIKELL
jgi:DNA-binding MarR family transcriptional regulator